MFKSVQKSVQRIVKKNPTLSMVVAFLVGYHLLQKINEGFEEVYHLKGGILKYLEEISQLFNKMKETDNYYGMNLFKANYCVFYEFIRDNVDIYDNINDDGHSDIDEENNVLYNK